MSKEGKKTAEVSEWMKVAQVGQLTRDASLKTRHEQEADRKQAAMIEELRKESA